MFPDKFLENIGFYKCAISPDIYMIKYHVKPKLSDNADWFINIVEYIKNKDGVVDLEKMGEIAFFITLFYDVVSFAIDANPDDLPFKRKISIKRWRMSYDDLFKIFRSESRQINLEKILNEQNI